MTAQTPTPREAADRMIEAELRAFDASLRRQRGHLRVARTIGTPVDGLVDWQATCDRATDRIAWIEDSATDHPTTRGDEHA